MRLHAVPPPAPASDQPRVGLVLGAGGITGIAWLLGALDALRDETGWDPAAAEVVSGTSAGAVVATSLAARVEPATLLRYAEDEVALAEAKRRAVAGPGKVRSGLAWPGSLALGAAGLLATSPRRRLASLAGFLPRGLRSTDDIRGLTHEAVSGGWPARPQLWLHACDYGTGERVTFGRPGAPEADLADAVAASCAVPAYYQPVEIGGRRYVDGGLWSFTNADALADAGCDVVICLAPLTARNLGPLLGSGIYGPLRAVARLRLAQEVRTLRAENVQVVTLEPTAADLRAMGLNPMDRRRSRRVLETARASVAPRLREALAGVTLGAAPRAAAAPLPVAA